MVEIDSENEKNDIDALNIEIPVLTPRVYRVYKNLTDLDVAALGHQRVAYVQFNEEEQTAGVIDYHSVIGYFA